MDTFLQMMGAQWQVILILALSFLVLVAILSKFLFKPLLGYLDERTKGIKQTYEEIAQSKEEMARLKEEYRTQLAGIERRAYDKIQEAVKDGLKMKTEIISEAHSQADQVLRRATQEIEMEKKKAVTELKTEVVNLSLLAAGRVIEEKMDEPTNQKIVERFLEDLEKTSARG